MLLRGDPAPAERAAWRGAAANAISPHLSTARAAASFRDEVKRQRQALAVVLPVVSCRRRSSSARRARWRPVSRRGRSRRRRAGGAAAAGAGVGLGRRSSAGRHAAEGGGGHGVRRRPRPVGWTAARDGLEWPRTRPRALARADQPSGRECTATRNRRCPRPARGAGPHADGRRGNPGTAVAGQRDADRQKSTPTAQLERSGHPRRSVPGAATGAGAGSQATQAARRRRRGRQCRGRSGPHVQCRPAKPERLRATPPCRAKPGPALPRPAAHHPRRRPRSAFP